MGAICYGALGNDGTGEGAGRQGGSETCKNSLKI